MSAYNLVSFNLCLFVQRSIITLEEKGVDLRSPTSIWRTSRSGSWRAPRLARCRC